MSENSERISWAWLDGDFNTLQNMQVSCQDRGFLLGDGLYETLLIHQGRPVAWDLHWKRFERSSLWACIPIPLTSEIGQQVTDELIQRMGGGDGILRLTLTRGDGGRGMLATRGLSRLLISLQPLPAFANVPAISVAICPETRSTGGEEWSHKSLHCGAQIRWRLQAAERGFDECLLHSQDACVLESTSSNIFVWTTSALVTPPANGNILPGVMRHLLIQLACSLGIPVEERPVPLEELEVCMGAFLSNSIRGIQPILRIENRTLLNDPRTALMQEALLHQIARY